MVKINIDINSKTMPTDYSWQFGLGADHAWQFHRTDVIDQLAYAKEEIGFKSVRFHGIFNDDMFTYQTLRAIAPLPKDNPVKECNFRQVAHVLDNIISTGVKPFVELSFMPAELAKGNKQGLKYKNNICPPKDYNKWAAYIKSFIEFLFERYGKDEVETWYFEVWNEPDLGIFFAGSQKDYFELYRVTAQAVKEVDEKLKVGGPSTSACKWIDEFMHFCKENNVPLDFVSTHHYPGDAFGNLITVSNYMGIAKTIMKAWKNKAPLGETLTKMFFNPKAAASVPKGALTKMDDELLSKTKDIPTIISEWNSMAIFSVPVHDEKYSAAFAMKSVLDLNGGFKGYMFWCLSDIFEEQLQLNEPFIGGYGIMTVDGIPKPNFWAFKMLSQLYKTRLDCGFRETKDVDYAAFIDGDKVQVIVFAQTNDPDEDNSFDVEIELNGIYNEVTVQIIDNDNCNPKKLWQEMGEPKNLKPCQVEEIKEKSALKEQHHPFIANSGLTTVKTDLRSNDIKMFTFYGE